MVRKLVLVLLLMLSITINAYASEQFDNGWHTVKNVKKTSDCKLDNVWGYYKDGVETIRRCKLPIAHRGWGSAPENSLEAFKLVKQKGYYGFELDVRFTKDNVPVLLHDATINRVARVKGKLNSEIKGKIAVKNLTFDELNSKYVFPITRDGKVLEKYKNNKITKFEDVIKYASENGLYIAIELKAGTKDQIASIVKMVQKYKMDNSRTRWISFQHLLLSYVNLADDNEQLGLLCRGGVLCGKDSADVCVPSDTSYCGTEKERKKYHKELDTANNFVSMKGDNSLDSRGRATSVTTDLPENVDTYPKNLYKLSAIPIGKITLDKTSVSINKGKSTTINYTYDGDGKVKCKSDDKSYVTCVVNSDNKTITISGIKNSSDIKVKVYATQGTKYSATNDYSIVVKINNSNNTSIIGDVNGNGKIDTNDYLLIRKHLLNVSLLTGDKLKQADVNNDSKVNSSDYITIRKIIINN